MLALDPMAKDLFLHPDLKNDFDPFPVVSFLQLGYQIHHPLLMNPNELDKYCRITFYLYIYISISVSL